LKGKTIILIYIYIYIFFFYKIEPLKFCDNVKGNICTYNGSEDLLITSHKILYYTNRLIIILLQSINEPTEIESNSLGSMDSQVEYHTI